MRADRERRKSGLKSLLASLRDHDPSFVITEIRRLAGEMADGEGDALLAAEPHLLRYRSTLRPLYREVIAENEKSKVREILASNSERPIRISSIEDPILRHVYSRSGAMSHHLDLNDCRRIVLVGCGWIPVTLFYFHDSSPAQELIGIDVLAEAIETAGVMARSFGYERVQFELANGLDYDFRDALIVYVVGVVTDKAGVLSRIADTAPENVQVVVNEPYSLGNLWHEAIEPHIDRRFEIAERGPGKGTLRNLLLRRRA